MFRSRGLTNITVCETAFKRVNHAILCLLDINYTPLKLKIEPDKKITLGFAARYN